MGTSKKIVLLFVVFVFIVFLGIVFMMSEQDNTVINLFDEIVYSNVTVEKAIQERRSIRSYKKEPITLKEISQLLRAAQGITSKHAGLRAAPSAGALYPLELYLVAGDIRDLPAGVYKYDPIQHGLKKVLDGDKRGELSSAALSQSWVASAAGDIVICAVYERTRKKYGFRADQYVHMEVGAVAENVYLQALAFNIGTVFVGAFHDDQVKKIIAAKKDEAPLCILPLGKK